MNKIYIETTKRKFFLSYADISIIDKEEILIGFKNKNLMTFKYSKNERLYKKIYDYDIETQEPIFEILKEIFFNNELVYKFEDKKGIQLRKWDDEMSTMTVKELAAELGLTELMTRELIKAGKFNEFAWALSVTGNKRVKICIIRERYELWKQGKDMEKTPKELANSMGKPSESSTIEF